MGYLYRPTLKSGERSRVSVILALGG